MTRKCIATHNVHGHPLSRPCDEYTIFRHPSLHQPESTPVTGCYIDPRLCYHHTPVYEEETANTMPQDTEAQKRRYTVMRTDCNIPGEGNIPQKWMTHEEARQLATNLARKHGFAYHIVSITDTVRVKRPEIEVVNPWDDPNWSAYQQ